MTVTLSFNLLYEPWIPCIMRGDGRPNMVGLREALTRAAEIGEIVDPSPLVTAALHRPLLAILHRNFGPRNASEWRTCWKRGSWDLATLDAYFDRWRDRFDLFNEARPFYQARSLDLQYAVPVAKLTHELASGNNATLFDHTTERTGLAFSPAEVARYLVAQQAFAIGGLVTYEKVADKAAKAAPLTKGAVSLVKGASLFETLMLNLHQYSQENEVPFASGPDDSPAWERDGETQAEDRLPKGYLDLLTWQSRRIRLQPETDDAGQIVVRQSVIMKGNQFPDGFERHGRETMLAFRRNPQAKPRQEAWSAVTFQEDRALWRDSLALFQSVEESHDRPRMLSWLDELVDHGILDRAAIVPVEFFGLSTDRGKIFFWRRELLPLPLIYLEDEDIFSQLRVALNLAERTGRLFVPGFDTITVNGAKKTIPRPVQLLGEGLASASDERQPPQDMVRRLIEHLAPGRLYWSQLETPFKRFLVDLARDQATDGNGDLRYGITALPAWAGEVERAAWGAFRVVTGSLDTSARVLRAAARAEREFARRLYHVLVAYRNGNVSVQGKEHVV